jgi:putative ABC transport system permease protein
LLDLAIETLRSLRAHALRFTLTSLGIAWGAMMLTYLSASTTGMLLHFEEGIEKTGPKIVWVIPGVVSKERVGERGARPVELEDEDVDRIDALYAVEDASPNLFLWNRLVRVERTTKLLNVFGVSVSGPRIRNFEVGGGRFFSAAEVDRSARVAVLGAEAKERLFGRRPALGGTVHVDSVPFRVVGVAARKGDQMIHVGGHDDEAILVPYTAAQRWLHREDTLNQVILAPRTRGASGETMRGVRAVLSRHHGFEPDDEPALSVIDVEEILGILYSMFFGLRLFVWAAGLVTLIVGAVSVMNIMIVVVSERTQEIGLRKAVGASNRAVFALFLAEATAVAGLSGLVGAVLGWVLVQVTARAATESPFTATPLFDPLTTGVLVAGLVVVGIVAGFVPAVRAARIAPAESLRAGA